MIVRREGGTGRADLAALATLLAVFALFVARSWLAWGHVDVDYGREMYVPLRLARGDVIYRDIRYPYGPFSPYLHALGYRLWKPHLNVLYASGLGSTALVILALYHLARQLASVPAALLGTALATVDLMFIPGSPSSFSYVFPYAFPAVHGTLFMLVALGGALRVLGGGGRAAAILSGTGIGLALLTKPEFGAAALVAGMAAPVGLALCGERRRAVAAAWALAGPAIGLPALGYGLLATAMPLEVILRKGLFDPQYFEASHHIAWLIAGLPPGATIGRVVEVLGAVYLSGSRWYLATAIVVSTVALAAGLVASWRGRDLRVAWGAAAFAAVMAAGVVARTWPIRAAALVDGRYLALPALLVIWIIVETWRLLREWRRDGVCAVPGARRWVALVVALGLLLRVPGRVTPGFYANFYLGPGIVLAACLFVDLLPRALTAMGGSGRAARAAALALVGSLGLVVGVARWNAWGSRQVSLSTPRGSLRLDAFDMFAPAYAEAVRYVTDQTRPGATVVAVPCETALYFLTDRGNHLYETALVANVTSEDAQRAYIAQLERERPAMVLTSSRPLFEYGLSYFGVGYGQLILHWIQEHYRLERMLGGKAFRIAIWRPR